MHEITQEPIDLEQVRKSVETELAGAIVLFIGTARKLTKGRTTVRLNYQSYEPMATTAIGKLVAEAHSRWDILKCTCVHRTGVVEIGEPSVAVAVSAAHRPAAFEAASWLIDTLKQQVPIWKQEHWDDGFAEWVHPGT